MKKLFGIKQIAFTLVVVYKQGLFSVSEAGFALRSEDFVMNLLKQIPFVSSASSSSPLAAIFSFARKQSFNLEHDSVTMRRRTIIELYGVSNNASYFVKSNSPFFGRAVSDEICFGFLTFPRSM